MNDKFEIKLKPEWSSIDEARDRVSGFLETSSYHEDKQYSIVMIVSELLENAIKYGKSDPDELITLEIEAGKKEIIIELRNRITENEIKNLNNLDKTLQWFRGFQSPFEAYIEKLKEISVQDLQNKESGLGLIRIAYEGQGSIDFYLDENEFLCVSVVVKAENSLAGNKRQL